MEKKPGRAVLVGCLAFAGLGALGLAVLVVLGAAVGAGVFLLGAPAVNAGSAAAPAPALDLPGAVAVLRREATAAEQAAALAALEREAQRGNSRAMVMTAACYRAGIGTAADDHHKAFEWYQKAAKAGEAAAMIEMSRYHSDGVWVEADPVKAKDWLTRAAARGSTEARWQLAQGGK